MAFLLLFCIAAPLLGLALEFSSGRTTYSAIAGYLPWSDAAGWHQAALQILLQGKGDEWSARRPLNAAFLAALLGASDERLLVALMLRAALLGGAAYFFGRAVARIAGMPAAFAGVVVIFSFAYAFLAATLAELNGLIFGTIGVAALLDATRERDRRLFAAGMALLTTGMMLRTGAVLVLPVLLVWAGFAFRGRRRFSLVPVLWGAAGVALAWLASEAAALLYMPPGTLRNANYGYTFYGLAKGGESWLTFCADMQSVDPSICQQGEAVSVREAYRRALVLITEDPLPLLRGMLDFAARYVRDFGVYVGTSTYPPAPKLLPWRTIFLALAAIGVVAALTKYRGVLRGLPIVPYLGVLASAALAYWSQDAYRALAATVPFDAVLASLGIGAVMGRRRPSGEASMPLGAIVLGAALSLAALALPWALGDRRSFRDAAAAQQCGIGERALAVELGKSSPYVELVGHPAFLPQVSDAAFHADPGFGGNEYPDTFRRLRLGDRLVAAIDLAHPGDPRTYALLLASITIEPARPYAICASPDNPGAPTSFSTVTAARPLGN